MSLAKRRAIAVLGGKAAQARGVAHRWTPAAARAAGLKGVATRQLPTCERCGHRFHADIASAASCLARYGERLCGACELVEQARVGR